MSSGDHSIDKFNFNLCIICSSIRSYFKCVSPKLFKKKLAHFATNWEKVISKILSCQTQEILAVEAQFC